MTVAVEVRDAFDLPDMPRRPAQEAMGERLVRAGRLLRRGRGRRTVQLPDVTGSIHAVLEQDVAVTVAVEIPDAFRLPDIARRPAHEAMGERLVRTGRLLRRGRRRRTVQFPDITGPIHAVLEHDVAAPIAIEIVQAMEIEIIICALTDA